MTFESDGKFITFACECGQKMKVPIENAGARGFCRACGKSISIPMRPTPAGPDQSLEPSPDHTAPVHRRQLDGTYTEEDLVTYPERGAIRERPPQHIVSPDEEEKTLFETLGEILRYPVADKPAMQIFFTGAFIFSPLMWKLIVFRKILGYIGLPLGCVGLLIDLAIFIAIIAIRLMFFTYLLLVIEKSAEGDRNIPDLPVFQTWDTHVEDLVKVVGVSLVAFLPYLVYSASINIQVYADLMETYARGETPATEILGGSSADLVALFMLYAITSFYMPMVLMTLVVKRSFGKAVNPVFIIRSILRIGREYLVAMLIIFLFLRGSLTAFTIIKDVLASDSFAWVMQNIFEPILKFYVFVVTMHVIGLLYYRNGRKLQW